MSIFLPLSLDFADKLFASKSLRVRLSIDSTSIESCSPLRFEQSEVSSRVIKLNLCSILWRLNAIACRHLSPSCKYLELSVPSSLSLQVKSNPVKISLPTACKNRMFYDCDLKTRWNRVVKEDWSR